MLTCNISKLKFSIILLATCFTSVTFAAGDSTACNPKWALQFAISSNFTLASFSGSNLSVQRQLKENRAMRLGITLTDALSDNNSKYASASSNTVSKSLSLSNNFNLKITSQYLYYHRSINNVRPYLGIGPYCGATISYSESEKSNDLKKSTEISQSFFLGITPSFGTEIYLNNKISLLAEYGTSLGYIYSISDYTYKIRSSVDDPYTITSQTIIKQHKITIQNNAVLFGISVHF